MDCFFRKIINQPFPTILPFQEFCMLCSLHIWTADLLTWFRVSWKQTSCKRTIIRWSCISASAGKNAFRPSLFRGDPCRLTLSRSVLRGIPRILDAAARGVPGFAEDSVDHCALTPLHVCIMISKNTVSFSDQNSKRKQRKNDTYVMERGLKRSVTWRHQHISQIMLC
jgi:hypothetical protein